jgi:hypothetical protein
MQLMPETVKEYGADPSIRSRLGRGGPRTWRAQCWTVDEDEHQRRFPSFDDALDCAREIEGDPDLPPLTQI